MFFLYQYKNTKKLSKSNTKINNINIKKILLLLKIDIYIIRHILIFPYSYIKLFCFMILMLKIFCNFLIKFYYYIIFLKFLTLHHIIFLFNNDVNLEKIIQAFRIL